MQEVESSVLFVFTYSRKTENAVGLVPVVFVDGIIELGQWRVVVMCLPISRIKTVVFVEDDEKLLTA